MKKDSSPKNPEGYPSSELSWLEMQVLYLLDQEPTYQKIVIEKIKKITNKRKKTSMSTLYNLLSKLRNKGLLEEVTIPEPGRGNKIYLKTTKLGKIELEKAIKWSLTVLFDLITQRVITDFQLTCKKHLNCKSNTSLLYITPFTLPLPKIINTCERCSKWDKKAPRAILFIPKPTTPKNDIIISFYQILIPHNSENIDIPLENQSVERILSLFTLNLIPIQKINLFLEKVYNVLTIGGKIAFVTIQKMDSYIIEEIEDITGRTGIIPFFSSSQSGLVQNYFSMEQIVGLLSPWFKNIETKRLKEFQYIVAEKR